MFLIFVREDPEGNQGISFLRPVRITTEKKVFTAVTSMAPLGLSKHFMQLAL